MIFGAGLLAILLGLLQIFRGTRILDDSFHDGEFFVAAIAHFADHPSGLRPTTIHGALDFIPALIAERLWGGDSYFLPTLATLVLGCLALVSNSSLKALLAGEYSWIEGLATPPANSLSTTEGVRWASRRLQQRDVHCVFDLSNNGVINGLIRRPSSSRFSYPVYAAPQHESMLIADLQSAATSAIVYSSTYWSYRIDGKSMPERFPELDKFVLLNYPGQECAEGYCVRFARE